jgi:acyl dehydratase
MTLAKTMRYEQHVIRGLLGIAITTGMLHELGIFPDSAVVTMSSNERKLIAPILVGDTLHLVIESAEFDGDRSERMGRLGRRFDAFNQSDETGQSGRSDLLINRRGAE